MKKSFFVLALIYFSFINNSFAQCSDAGICSIGGHSYDEQSASFSLSLGYSYGYSGKDDDISYNSINFSGSYLFSKSASVNLMIPFNRQSGPLYNINGIGDLLLSLSYGFGLSESHLTFSAGMRFATASENRDYVIQPYKSGLGSNDILFAVDYFFSGFSFGAGYQLAGKPVDDDLTIVERGDDLLFRSGYVFTIDDFSINPQLLFIKRLGKSKMYFFSSDPGANSIPLYLEVDGSDQSQLNLLVNTTYRANQYYSLFLEVAVPFLKRDVNVDGLTRAFTISSGLRFSF